MSRCELTHVTRTAIDFALLLTQHERYARTLAALGCEVTALEAAPELPDSVFVEDTVVVFDEVAVLTRPGAASRRPEVASVARELVRWRRCTSILEPGTLDGGDVLRIGRDVFVGQSGRSNDDGIRQLRAIVEPYGYRVVPVALRGCLHLKSAVTRVGEDTLLINDDWVDRRYWHDLRFVAIAPEEPHAANALWLAGSVISPASVPRAHERLAAAGMRVVPLDVSEIQKAEGGVTCCSVIFAP